MKYIFNKNKVRVRSLVFALIIILSSFSVFTFVPASAATTSKQDKSTLKGYESNLSSLKKKLSSIEADIAAAKKQKASEETKKALYDNEISNIIEQIETLDAVISGYNEQIESIDKEVSQLEKRIDSSYKMIRECLVFSQENGSSDYIDFVLGSDSISDLLTRIEVVGDLVEYENKLITGLTEDKNSLATKKESMENAKKLCETYNEEYEASKANLQTKIDASIAYIEDIEASASESEAEKAKIIAERNALESQISSLSKQIAEKEAAEKKAAEAEGKTYNPGFVSSSGLRWPLAKGYTISQYYNSYEMGSRHTGIDIATNRTPVPCYSAAAGKVITASSHYSYGNYVMINHGNGLVTLYAHLSNISVHVGDIVEQGQRIGTTGTTGRSTGIHLHFMVIVNGKDKNPLNYVKKP